MKKCQQASQSQDELIAALFYLYQEALKKNRRQAEAIQVAIERCEKLGPAAPKSKNTQDILKQFYVMREFQKLDEAQKELFLEKIDELPAKTQKKSRRATGGKTARG